MILQIYYFDLYQRGRARNYIDVLTRILDEYIKTDPTEEYRIGNFTANTIEDLNEYLQDLWEN